MRKKISVIAVISLLAVCNAESVDFTEGSNEKQVEVISAKNNPVVQVFDISGIVLGSTYEYVIDDVIKESGYKIELEETRYPKFFEYNYNYECRALKQATPTQMQKCTREKADQNKQLYTNYMKLKKDSTGEVIELYLTSNQTSNQVYQIVYANDADKSEGIGETYEYQRQEKLRHFLLKVYEKFGTPNMIDTYGAAQIWSSDLTDPKKPVMRVYYGKIILEDLSLFELDNHLSEEKAKKTFKAKSYDF